ncbi:MAG: hypothetical protein F8N36_14310 [Desulfovibrio sp.]|uniref:hypothetical protein n=1 Tax=Desulfovibrio sp. TaxID=885 RepID=UPI00135EF1D1|nr:hypothetical protein [Desulfovibrio sp.]MTJ94011.1 hypothetical protein [Desulfovibrio sp.]
MFKQFAVFAAFFTAYVAALAAGIYIGANSHPLIGLAVMGFLILVIYRVMDKVMQAHRRDRKRAIFVSFPPLASVTTQIVHGAPLN